ncbi:YppG family protein [Lentibacillus sediminis]|uniref:YppG family protein n=1 Tax=Lentibacillus sediminis TaxID=1940529 RepID=UPI000C1C3E5A|nr:YppG family protein [Lentibacillus sediminis]
MIHHHPYYHWSIPHNEAPYHYIPYEPMQPHTHTTFHGPMTYKTPYEQFAKPEQPQYWPDPSQSFAALEQPYSASSQTAKGGQIDFDKMLATVGQLAGTYHQVSPIIKEVNTLIKAFR